jgi:hypothetical protein
MKTFFFETASRYIVQAGLKLLGSSNPPTLVSRGVNSWNQVIKFSLILRSCAETSLDGTASKCGRAGCSPITSSTSDHYSSSLYHHW